LTLSLGPSESGPTSRGPDRRARPFLILAAAAAVILLGLLLYRRPPPDGRRPVPPARPGMVGIAASTFTMGSTDAEIAAAFAWCRELTSSGCDVSIYARERPARSVMLSGFAIDATEVTNEAFASWLQTVPGLAIESGRLVRADGQLLADLHPAFAGLAVESGHIRARPGQERRPVVQVSWTAARRYCAAQSKRLPSEAEWERAARGLTRRAFPWGDARPDCRSAVFARGADGGCALRGGGAADVGTTAGDRTPEGVFDLAGNVSEWVEDTFQPQPPECPPPCRDPVFRGPQGEKSCRGGNWGSLAEMCRAAGRGRRAAGEVSHQIGFRCAAEP
jgi:serine/threonine-protein kinase